jgi:hypothetical protein
LGFFAAYVPLQPSLLPLLLLLPFSLTTWPSLIRLALPRYTLLLLLLMLLLLLLLLV